MSEQLTKQQEKLVEILQEFFKPKEEDRERIIRIVKNNNPKKIVVALNNTYKIDRKGKKRPITTLEEFEKMLKKVRY